ncbi:MULTISPECIES: hypothetical protein [Wolbachia]|uniref:hypothetical protein n=1 Tax=Wolbachia TaxID=953 RepID=UPI0002403C87|nr:MULTISPECIES: hypothetical protein [Wolbachia]QBB83939.1 hypothetical protein DEJ70_04030 [Wolbachia pipientis wAlbB]QDW08744.1 hypothetical protein CO539_004015 [Wolbachia pipientis]QDW09938.1 hypothetical protein CO538_004020 [Wolbachia pipientis]QZA83015.1 hypothetical protein K1Y75_03910 [Wolbachia pipientis]THA19554.1 hypothetical protein EJE47_06600 [Wolbachia endosymbiont of Aedes albopictus]
MIAGFTKGDKAVKAEKTSDQLRELSVAEYVVKSIHDLQKLHNRLCSSQGNNCVNDREKFVQDSDGLGIFQFLKSYINDAEKNEPSIKNLTIMKFLRSIIEDRELYKKLCSFDDFLDCELENLRDKISLLALLREEMDFTDIQKAYGNWRFSNLIGDNDFKRMYVDEAVKEREKPVNEDFEKNIGKYIELVKEGKEVASRYFGKWKEDFQVYCEEIDNNNKVLNINLTHYDNSEPTKISDVLQQEKDIKELNIYCNKKHEIHAHKKDKKRYYEFKEGAYYEMTSTWAAKDGSGMCTMIMNVSSDGITEILKFNGEDFVSSKEILELIKQNDELYIQGLSLYDAVMESLEENRATPINLYNESMVAYQGKEPEGKLDHKVDADNSLPSSPSINSNALEANLQHTETQPEIASQQIRTQEETNSQRMDELIPDNQISSKENVELKQEMSSLKKGATELKQEIEAETIVKLERHDSDLKDELEEEVKFDIEDPEIEYEEFPEDILELIEDEDSIDELQENYSDIIADQIQTIEEMKEEIENLNNQVKYLEDQQDQVTDKQKISKTISGYAKQYYSLMGEVFSELDNESDVPLKEKTTLHKSPSLDSGLDSDEENCDNDLSSNISSISSVEKVAESRNVGNLLSSCIIWR